MYPASQYDCSKLVKDIEWRRNVSTVLIVLTSSSELMVWWNKLNLDRNQNVKNVLHKNDFENATCDMAAMYIRFHCVHIQGSLFKLNN